SSCSDQMSSIPDCGSPTRRSLAHDWRGDRPIATGKSWRGTEAVITAPTRNRLGALRPTWVRIPPSPPLQQKRGIHLDPPFLLEPDAARFGARPGRAGRRLSAADPVRHPRRRTYPPLVSLPAGSPDSSATGLPLCGYGSVESGKSRLPDKSCFHVKVSNINC